MCQTEEKLDEVSGNEGHYIMMKFVISTGHIFLLWRGEINMADWLDMVRAAYM
jgi:hypothetical protein